MGLRHGYEEFVSARPVHQLSRFLESHVVVPCLHVWQTVELFCSCEIFVLLVRVGANLAERILQSTRSFSRIKRAYLAHVRVFDPAFSLRLYGSRRWMISH